MIPSAWVGVVMALGVYRISRLLGWDDFPPVARARAWVTGEYVISRGDMNQQAGLTKIPPEIETRFRRPLLEHFLHCPFCQGFWLSVIAYVAWVFAPTETVYFLAAWALSAAVGLIARNLDP